MNIDYKKCFAKIISLIHILFFWFSLLSSISVYSQNFSNLVQFEKIDYSLGLNGPNLHSIYQDSQGFLWICSINGIFKYNGFEFVQYKSNAEESIGLSDDDILNVFEDKKGQFWAISSSGLLSKFNVEANGFQNIEITWKKKVTDKVYVTQILEDKAENLWVVSKKDGLLKFNPELNTVTKSEIFLKELENVRLAKIENEQDKLWAVTDSEIYCISNWSGNSSKRFIRKYEVQIKKVLDLAFDKLGSVWLGGFMNDLIQLDTTSGEITSYAIGLNNQKAGSASENRINAICFDGDGKVWIGMNFNGLMVIDPETSQKYYLANNPLDPKSISHNTITDINIDRNGVIWITTWGNGLNKYVPSKNKFGHYRSVAMQQNSLSNSIVNSFYEESNGIIWIATENGINKFDPESGNIEPFKIPAEISNDHIFDIYCIKNFLGNENKLWIGTNNGLYIFDKISKKFTKWESKGSKTTTVEDKIIYFLDQDSNGTLWALCYFPFRLFKYDTYTKDFIPVNAVEQAKTVNEPLAIIDQNHNLWISEKGVGFFKYNLETGQLAEISLENDKSGFIDAKISFVFSESEDLIWVGSRQGLFRLENQNGSFIGQRFTEKEGIIERNIQGILMDENGNLWLSTENGISKYNPNSKKFKNFSRSDGLQGEEFGYGTCLKSKISGKMYFGGLNGFNVFSPSEIKDDTSFFNLVFTEISSIKGISVLKKYENQSLIFPIPPKIIFKHDEKVINFNFAALHFAEPTLNQYQYKLEGFDNEWRNSGAFASATYTNLPFGNYIFKVKASNKDGVWKKEEISANLKVLPPWWRTWWAYGTYLFIFFLSLIILFNYQLQRQKERSEANRLVEMDKLKTRLYANITHEFRTPLTVIIGMAEKLINQPNKELIIGLKLIKRNGISLLSLINQMLDLAKLESNGLKVNLIQGDIISFIKYVCESFETLAESKDINLEFLSDNSQIQMDYDPVKMLNIVSNIISNAIKFTPIGGFVNVQMLEKNSDLHDSLENGGDFSKQFYLKVVDSGIGISAINLPHIFDRFYQADNSSTRKSEGSGIGLALTKELVELLGGDIKVVSEIDKGTEMHLTFPITKDARQAKFEDIISFPEISSNLDANINGDKLANYYQEDNLPLLLIVEDNSDVMFFLKSCLEDSFYILSANNGKDGVQKAFETIPDIIISDVMMPIMDGLEMCNILKKDKRTSHIPLLMLTARASIEDKLAGLTKGADIYMAKPFHREELLLQIQNLLIARTKLHESYRKISETNFVPIPNEEIESDFLLKFRNIIENDSENLDLSIDIICKNLLMSRMQLHRKIKALTNYSTSKYIRLIRLQKAKILISNENFTISEVAYRVGFSDPKYFSRVFSEEYGISPLEFRNKTEHEFGR